MSPTIIFYEYCSFFTPHTLFLARRGLRRFDRFGAVERLRVLVPYLYELYPVVRFRDTARYIVPAHTLTSRR